MTDTEEPQPLADLSAAVESMLANVKPVPAADVLAWEMKHEIAPRLADLGFAERFRREIPDYGEPKQAKAAAQCRGKLIQTGAIVALVGLRGVGKTTIAAQLAIERVRAWLAWHAVPPEGRLEWPPLGMARYRKAADLVARYKSLYADFGSINAERLAEQRNYECREWSLLVIDEVHECDDQKMKDRVLTDIIDRRYSARTDTLLISNQSVEDFKVTTNPSVMSRLGEHGCIIPCSWRSFRAK